MKAPHLMKGSNAETFARHWLEDRGLTCVQTNFRCRLGEIDLIMREQETLVFVEVRYRSYRDFGTATQTVTAAKQNRIARAAASFLRRQPALSDMPLRFDVIGLSGPTSAPQVDWRRQAFCFDYP